MEFRHCSTLEKIVLVTSKNPLLVQPLEKMPPTPMLDFVSGPFVSCDPQTLPR